MIWADIQYYVKKKINFVSGRRTSDTYIKLINKQLNRYAVRITSDDCIFHQNNTVVHTAIAVQ